MISTGRRVVEVEGFEVVVVVVVVEVITVGTLVMMVVWFSGRWWC